MLCIDSSGRIGPVIKPLAEKAGLELRVCADTHESTRCLTGTETYTLLVIVDDGDSVNIIRSTRLLAHRSELPIAFVMHEGNHDLAFAALTAGATEVFVGIKSDALAEMALALTQSVPDSELNGHVLLVEDCPIQCARVTQLCDEIGLEVHTCLSVEEGIASLKQRDYVLAILDVVLPGLQSGLALVKHIRKSEAPQSSLPILVVSGFDDVARRLEALRCGADDFLTKPFADEEFFWRVRRVMDVGTTAAKVNVVPPAMIRSAQDDWQKHGLSQREMEICEALILGKTDKQIAHELRISFWTVRTHVSSVFAKLQLFNRRELLTRYLPGRKAK